MTPIEIGDATLMRGDCLERMAEIESGSVDMVLTDPPYGTTACPPLMEYLIKTYTHPGDTVLDCTMGSGTTGVGTTNTGRKFIGIEKDSPDKADLYFNIACGRILEAYLNANTT